MSKSVKKKTEVAVVAPTSNAVVPAYLGTYKGSLGTENIDSGDVAIPRLKIAQSLTQQVKDGEMDEGALYLNVTGEAIAKPGDKLRIVPIAQGKEYILWRPRQDGGGGVLARAKPALVNGEKRYAWDKKNQTFDVKVGGKVPVKWKTRAYIDEDGLAEWGSEIPGEKDSGIAATAHHNYVVALPDHDNMIVALSLSRSQAKKAKDFNGTLKMGSTPMFARVFELSTVEEKNAKGPFKNVQIRPAGFVPDQGSFEYYKSLAGSFNDRGFTVDQSDEDSEEVTEGAL
jgi:hypothetical protein